MSYVRRFLEAFNALPPAVARAILLTLAAVLIYLSKRFPALAEAFLTLAVAMRSPFSPHPETPTDGGSKSE